MAQYLATIYLIKVFYTNRIVHCCHQCNPFMTTTTSSSNVNGPLTMHPVTISEQCGIIHQDPSPTGRDLFLYLELQMKEYCILMFGT